MTLEHAKGWIVRGHNVTWLTADYSGAKKEEIIEGVKIIRRAGSFTIYLYVPLFLLLHAKEYDVIVDEVHGFPFFSPLFTRKPVVVFIHEIAGEIWDFMFPFPRNIIGKFLEHIYFRLYRHCLFWTIAPSTVEELVSRGIPRSLCTAIPNPIIVDNRFRTKRFGPKEATATFLFVSRVVRMKGIEEIIKAFSFIVKVKSDSKLWIVGKGEKDYIKDLKHMIADYGVTSNVTFYGAVTEERKYELMARAHLLLHASVKEGWGLVVSEAAFVGTPAVVYNVSGLKDVVKDQKTGIVIIDNSPQEMARQAILLYNDKKKYALFQKNGRAWVQSLSWDRVICQSSDLLERAIGK